MQSIHRNALNKFYATCSVEAATITMAVIARSKCELDPEILCEHRSVLTRNVNTPELVGRSLADVERDLILETLKFCLGNRTKAAKILGLSIRTMRNRLNEFASQGLSILPPTVGTRRVR